MCTYLKSILPHMELNNTNDLNLFLFFFVWPSETLRQASFGPWNLLWVALPHIHRKHYSTGFTG